MLMENKEEFLNNSLNDLLSTFTVLPYILINYKSTPSTFIDNLSYLKYISYIFEIQK